MPFQGPQVDTIEYPGGPHATLLLHGFTATPDNLRTLADRLKLLGLTVLAPLLAGHGGTKEELELTGWSEWYQTAEQSFIKLKSRYDSVSVAGLSMGGLLALKLAEDHPKDVRALACLATPLHLHFWSELAVKLVARTPLIALHRYQKKSGLDVNDKRVKAGVWNVEEMPVSCIDSIVRLQHVVKKDLSKIVAPTVLIHSPTDQTAPYDSMAQIAEKISSSVIEQHTLKNSGHLITVDFEKDLVSETVGKFFWRYQNNLL